MIDETGKEYFWDNEKAQQLHGSLVLAALTYLNPDETIICKVACFGIVQSVSETEGVVIQCLGETWKGQLMTLPSLMDNFQAAKTGRYVLETTGETLIDPGFTTAWELIAPSN
jgi:hypothetical protein